MDLHHGNFGCMKSDKIGNLLKQTRASTHDKRVVDSYTLSLMDNDLQTSLRTLAERMMKKKRGINHKVTWSLQKSDYKII